MKRYKNNKGIAMFVVLAVMGVVITVASIAMYIANNETKMTNNYTNAENANVLANNYARYICDKWWGYSNPKEFYAGFFNPLKTDFDDFEEDDNVIIDLEEELNLSKGSSGWEATTDADDPTYYVIIINVDYKGEKAVQTVRLWYTGTGNPGCYIGTRGNLVIDLPMLVSITEFDETMTKNGIINELNGNGQSWPHNNPPYNNVTDSALVIDAWYKNNNRTNENDESWLILRPKVGEDKYTVESGNEYKMTVYFDYLGYYYHRTGNYLFSVFFLLDVSKSLNNAQPRDMFGYCIMVEPDPFFQYYKANLWKWDGENYIYWVPEAGEEESAVTEHLDPYMTQCNQDQAGSILPVNRANNTPGVVTSTPGKLEIYFSKDSGTDEISIKYAIDGNTASIPNIEENWTDDETYIGFNLCSSRVAIRSVTVEKID